MLVNHGPSQQSSKEEYKPWKYCATAGPCYKDHVTNKEVHAKIQQAIPPHKDLLTIIKRRKLQWYGHVSHSSDLAKTILQGTVKGERLGMDRPGVRQVPKGSGEQRKIKDTDCETICGAPTTLAIKG